MVVEVKGSCTFCHLVFASSEVRVFHKEKPYHEGCLKEAKEAHSPRFRVADLLLVIDRQGIRVVPKHHFGR